MTCFLDRQLTRQPSIHRGHPGFVCLRRVATFGATTWQAPGTPGFGRGARNKASPFDVLIWLTAAPITCPVSKLLKAGVREAEGDGACVKWDVRFCVRKPLKTSAAPQLRCSRRLETESVSPKSITCTNTLPRRFFFCSFPLSPVKTQTLHGAEIGLWGG